MPETEQISSSGSANDVRRELDAKIEKKVSYEIFFGILVILIGITGSVIYYAVDQAAKANEKVAGVENKLSDINARLSVVESKLGIYRK
jgi:hypothetical protein